MPHRLCISKPRYYHKRNEKRFNLFCRLSSSSSPSLSVSLNKQWMHFRSHRAPTIRCHQFNICSQIVGVNSANEIDKGWHKMPFNDVTVAHHTHTSSNGLYSRQEPLHSRSTVDVDIIFSWGRCCRFLCAPRQLFWQLSLSSYWIALSPLCYSLGFDASFDTGTESISVLFVCDGEGRESVIGLKLH